MKLSHSRMPFVRVYFRETQELVFDAHDKAAQFYGGVCRRGIYDNIETAGKHLCRQGASYNCRFRQIKPADYFDRTGGLYAGLGWGEGSALRTRWALCVTRCSGPSLAEEPHRAERVACGPQSLAYAQRTSWTRSSWSWNNLGRSSYGRTRQPVERW